MRKSKAIIMAMAIVLALATVISGATFAWFTSQDSATNHLENGSINGDTKIVEVFDPADPLLPGGEVNKDVAVVNTGAGDAVVRVSFAELLTILGNSGNPAYGNAKWTAASTNVPDIFSDAAVSAFSTWTTLDSTTSVFSFDSAWTWDANVVVKYRTVALTGGKTGYEFATYSTPMTSTDPKINGKAQNVRADIHIVGYTTPAPGKPILGLTTGTTQYPNNWNFLSFVSDVKTPIKWGALANFTPESGYTQAKPAAADFTGTPPATASKIDPAGYIQLVFNTTVQTTLAACNAGDWWYNDADGYFYYIGVLKSGQTTSKLLDAVKLSSSAGNAYSNLSYDLVVKMEGLQASAAAINSVWATATGLATKIGLV